MNKNEYFSNCFISIITNKFFHLIISFIEYYLTIAVQIIIFLRQFQNNNNEKADGIRFHLYIASIIRILPVYIKLIIIITIYILILLYFFIFNKYSFKQKYIWKIIINIFEIFLFRVFFIIISHLLFSLNGISLIICILLSIPIYLIIVDDFLINHLYYFSPHFITYPYDYYSSINDIFHLIVKILICIALQSTNENLNKYLFIVAFLFQIIILFFSIYIFIYKSYYIMNNIFLNKARFSFLLSSVLINIIMILLGINNIKNIIFPLIIINTFITFFVIIQVFYNPYKYAFFDNDENIENIFYYFFIIDHLRNESFTLEEKLENHYSSCNKCDLCKKLKKYLMNKMNYKKLYKILYKDVGILSKIMNELIHTILVHGKQSLKNYSYYLINIIYSYYINLNNNNYLLNLNLKILYEIINKENIQESHLLSTEQIFLINEFLYKADKTLNEIQDIILEHNIKKKYEKIFLLFNNIFELKEKKYKEKLFFNKNEGLINFSRYISICSMIYEEIFNTTLSNNQISLKENQIFLDDLNNKSNIEINQIIIQIDLLNFEIKIIYIIGEFSKYKNKSLCQLFPNVFRTKQLLLIKNKIINLKNGRNAKNEKEKKDFFNTNDNIDEGCIELKCIITDEEEKKKKFKLLNLRLNLIYQLEITKKILLSGIYSVEKNIIITLDKGTKEKKNEIVLNYDEEENENKYNSSININKSLIKYKKNERYFNNRKLIFINSYSINPNIYNIYYVSHTDKQKTIKVNTDSEIKKSKKSNLYYDIDSKVGDSEANQNFNFLIQSQTSASTFNQFSNDRYNLKKRGKGNIKNNKRKNNFKYYQYFLLIFSILMLFIQIICHLSVKKYNNYNSSQNRILILFRNYYGLFNILFTSTLSVVCLANETKGDYCINLFERFEKNIKNYSEFNKLNFTWFFLDNNNILSNQIINIKHQINEILSNINEEEINQLVNSKIPTYYFSQNISQNQINLNIYIENKTFIDVLEYMTNGFLIMSSKYEYLNEIIYITDKINNKNINFSPFIHIKLNSQLTQYQSHFYYLILNYHIFIQRFDLLIFRLIIKFNILFAKSIKMANVFITINLIFYILLHAVVIIFIHKYYKIIAQLLEEMQNKMNLKNDNISVREMFLQKISKLKVIISLYKQNIYQAIIDLNFIYDNYKKFIEEKNKEIAKYLKKEKYLNDSYNNNNYNNKLKNIKIKDIISTSNKRNIYCILITFIYSFILTFFLAYNWGAYFFVYQRITSLVKTHGTFSDDAYKLINYYLLMIYNNITLEDINRYEKYNISIGQNLFSKIYSNLQDLYDSRKIMNKLSGFNLDNIDAYYNYTCSSYYEYLFNTNILLKNKNNSYKKFMIFLCEDSKIFKFNNYKQIFSILFEYIQIGINQINDHSYKGLISNIDNIFFSKTILIFLMVYHYAFEILGLQLQRKSYQKIISSISSYVNVSFLLYYLSSFCFILIIIFGYIWDLNKKYNKINQIKKVFKICNKKE